MADAVFIARNNVFALTTGAKTVLNIIAGANQPVSIIEWGVSFDGVTSNAVPATVELMSSTQATAGTVGATPPAVFQVNGNATAAQFTVQHNYTAEPTVLTQIEQLFVPQFMGTFQKQYPLGQEPRSDLSGGTNKALAIRINASANVNVLAYARVVIG